MICGSSIWGKLLFENNYKNFSTYSKMITKSLGKLHKIKVTGEDTAGNKYSSL